MKEFQEQLMSLLTLKIGDGVSESPRGLSNLNRDIRNKMQEMQGHSSFSSLRYCGDLNIDFSNIWSKLEQQVSTWRDDDDRMARLQKGMDVHEVQRLFFDVEVEGAGSGGMAEDDGDYGW